jgi:hypothetical protein
MSPAASPITDPRLEEAYQYWRRKAAGGRMLLRCDLDPVEIPRLLPHLMLVEVLGPGRYRYRLIGTEIAGAQGTNATGAFVHEVLKDPDYRAHVLQLYDRCVADRCVIYSESLFISPQAEVERHTKVLFLPLSEDGEAVHQVMVMQVFLYIDQQTRNRHFIDARAFKEIAHAVL